MKKIVCDRCGAELTGQLKIEWHKGKKIIDLCSNCDNELETFLKKVPEKKPAKPSSSPLVTLKDI